MEFMDYFIGFLILCSLFNFAMYLIYFNRFRKLDQVLTKSAKDHSWRGEKLADYQVTNIIIDVLNNYVKNDITRKVEVAGKEMINKTVNSTVHNRVSELSKELASKYTAEHFENELREKMTERIGNDISSRLLGQY